MDKMRPVGAIVVLALAIILAACQAAQPPTPSSGKATPASADAGAPPEGVLRIGVGDWAGGTADPPVAAEREKKLLILMFDWLVGATPDGSDISQDTGIASKWEQSGDGRNWTFFVRKGVQFHDGYGEVTAEDVKFSFERVLNSPRSTANFVPPLKAALERIEVADPYTVKFFLKKPIITLAYDLSPLLGTEGIVVSKKYLEKVGEDEFTRHPIGSGPYKFAELAAGSYLKLQAMDKHFAIGVPKFKEVYIQLVHEESTRISMLKTGELDVIEISADRAGEMESSFQIVEKPAGMDMVIYLNSQWQGGLADKRVRQAIDLAVDKGTLLRTMLRGKGSILPGHMVTSWAMGSKPLKPHPYDPDKAKALLAEAGQSNIELDFVSTPGLSLLTEAISEQLRKVGFRPKINVMDQGAISAKYQQSQATAKNPPLNAIYVYTLPNRIFPHGLYRAVFTSGGTVTIAKDPKLDALVDDLEKAENMDAYAARVRAIQEYMDAQVITVPLFQVSTLFAANSRKTQKWSGGGKMMYEIGERELVSRSK